MSFPSERRAEPARSATAPTAAPARKSDAGGRRSGRDLARPQRAFQRIRQAVLNIGAGEEEIAPARLAGRAQRVLRGGRREARAFLPDDPPSRQGVGKSGQRGG